MVVNCWFIVNNGVLPDFTDVMQPNLHTIALTLNLTKTSALFTGGSRSKSPMERMFVELNHLSDVRTSSRHKCI